MKKDSKIKLYYVEKSSLLPSNVVTLDKEEFLKIISQVIKMKKIKVILLAYIMLSMSCTSMKAMFSTQDPYANRPKKQTKQVQNNKKENNNNIKKEREETQKKITKPKEPEKKRRSTRY